MILNSNSARYREQLWQACADSETGHVHCNLCGGRVLPTEAWEESHIGTPAAHDGNTVGIAHKRCNRQHGLAFVIPLVAKAKRMWRKHRGIDGPGLGPNALPGGRRSRLTKKLDGTVEPRLYGDEKHARTMAILNQFGRPE